MHLQRHLEVSTHKYKRTLLLSARTVACACHDLTSTTTCLFSLGLVAKEISTNMNPAFCIETCMHQTTSFEFPQHSDHKKDDNSCNEDPSSAGFTVALTMYRVRVAWCLHANTVSK